MKSLKQITKQLSVLTNSVTLKKLLHWLLIPVSVLLFTTHAFALETITYYHVDALGSPIAATDATGNLLWREQYRPFGERILKEAAADSNTRWFTSHPQDASGLVYMGARYYDPQIGRFLSIDPKGFNESSPMSFNRYAYANNNPYKYIDPDGEWALDVNIVFIGGTIGTDEGTGQPFWKFRGGLTGLGILIYPSYDFSSVPEDGKVGDCEYCDESAGLSGFNASLGVTAGIGIVSFEGNLVETGKEVIYVKNGRGNVSTYVNGKPLGFLKGRYNIGWSRKSEGKKKKIKSRYGENLSIDANAEWGGIIPWSRLNKNVVSLRKNK